MGKGARENRHAEARQGEGMKGYLNDFVATFHRPHPAKEAKPYQVVRDARIFLESAGVKP